MRLTLSTKYLFGLALLLSIGTPAASQSPPPDFTHVTITLQAKGGPGGLPQPNFKITPETNTENLGAYPAYSVSLDENGTVTYNGVYNVNERGERVHSIPIGAVRDLVTEFLRI